MNTALICTAADPEVNESFAQASNGLPKESAVLLITFAEQFQQLVDVLCWAAQAGDHPKRRDRFETCRSWFSLNYHQVRPLLWRALSLPQGAFDSPLVKLISAEEIDELLRDGSALEAIEKSRTLIDQSLDFYLLRA